MSKHADTHQRILEAAWNLFTEQGFNDTSTRQISAASNIAVGTLFNHFSDKVAILEACLDDKFNDVLERAKETDIHRPARLKINHYAQRNIFISFIVYIIAFIKCFLASDCFRNHSSNSTWS